MVWGQPLPRASVGEAARSNSAGPLSRGRALAGLGVVGLLTAAMESSLGPRWGVVLVAGLGSGGAVLFARAGRRFAMATLLVVSLTGLGWIELVNKVQYGTLALTGAPPLVRWCGATYRPNGVVTSALSAGVGTTYSEILRTPSGYDVFGLALRGRRSCGTAGTLFVGVGPERYAAYGP